MLLVWSEIEKKEYTSKYDRKQLCCKNSKYKNDSSNEEKIQIAGFYLCRIMDIDIFILEEFLFLLRFPISIVQCDSSFSEFDSDFSVNSEKCWLFNNIWCWLGHIYRKKIIKLLYYSDKFLYAIISLLLSSHWFFQAILSCFPPPWIFSFNSFPPCPVAFMMFPRREVHCQKTQPAMDQRAHPVGEATIPIHAVLTVVLIHPAKHPPATMYGVAIFHHLSSQSPKRIRVLSQASVNPSITFPPNAMAAFALSPLGSVKMRGLLRM